MIRSCVTASSSSEKTLSLIGRIEASNLYYHYYNAQAMINRGGDDWDDYNALFRDKLLAAQNEDGSWWRGEKVAHGAIGPHMATCLATFMFEVYYRFLPATGLKTR